MSTLEIMDRICSAYTNFLGVPCSISRIPTIAGDYFEIESGGVILIGSYQLTFLLDQLKGQHCFR